MTRPPRPRDVRRRGRQRGAIGALVAVLAPAIIALVGLVYDGGVALATRQRGLDVAEQAARAAANLCDPVLLRSRSDCVITDVAAAQQIVQAYLGNGVDLVQFEVSNAGHTVVVQVRATASTFFLGLFGFHRFSFTMTRAATAVTGLA